jgi:pimeloyl-ACP methyl ester carboxylesterase
VATQALPVRRARISGRGEHALVLLAVGLVALHVVDDSFVQPQPGTSATDDLVGGLVPLALLALAAVAYPRLRHGYGVLLFDRRGEGDSEGDPNALGWNGDRDIKAAIAFLRERAEVDPDRIGGIGLSVGGELMLETAAETDAGSSGSSTRRC